MAGIVNDNIVFPVLDLIHREIRKYTSIHNIEGNPLEGEPSVTLLGTSDGYREGNGRGYDL